MHQDKKEKVEKSPIASTTSNVKESHGVSEDSEQPRFVGNMWVSTCISEGYRNNFLVSENSNVIPKEIPDEALPSDAALQELSVSKSGESDGEAASKKGFKRLLSREDWIWCGAWLFEYCVLHVLNLISNSIKQLARTFILIHSRNSVSV